MATPTVDPRVERARLLYVGTDVPLDEIARRLNVPKTTLRTWITKHGWPRRPPRPFGRPPTDPSTAPSSKTTKKTLAPRATAPAAVEVATTVPPATLPTPPAPAARPAAKRKRPTAKSLADRLYRIINHHIEVMESRMSDDDHTATSENPERDARAIGNLVRSVEKLKEFEPDQSKREPGSVRHSRYPLSPGEEEKLRDEIVDRLLRLRERLRSPRAD